MKTRLLLMAGCWSVWLAATEFAQTQTANPVKQTDVALTDNGYFQQAYAIADRVHVLMQGPGLHVRAVGNVTVVEQKDGLVLIDAGGTPGAGRRIVELVRGISPKPVKAIIISHWHGDHHFGLSEVLKAWPQAVVIATAQTRSHMNNRGLPAHPDDKYDSGQIANFEQARQDYLKESQSDKRSATERSQDLAGAHENELYESDFRGASIRFATLTFTDKIVLEDEFAPIEVMFLGRANTDGDAIVWLPKQRVLVTGDVVVSPIQYGDGSYPLEWVKALEKLRAFDFAVLVPGHGLPEEDHVYLDKLIAAFHDVDTQMERLTAQNLDMDAAIAKMDFAAQEKDFVDDPWLDDYFEGYWEPVAACAYRQIKGNPAVQGKGCHP